MLLKEILEIFPPAWSIRNKSQDTQLPCVSNYDLRKPILVEMTTEMKM